MRHKSKGNRSKVRNEEEQRIYNLIRKGELPQWHLAKGKDMKLERTVKGKLTWRLVNTYAELTKVGK